jgi:hypothetical protein
LSVTAQEWLTLGIGVILPALVELVCHRLAAPGFKVVVLLTLAGINSVLLVSLAAVGSHAGWDWSQVVFLGLTGFGTAVLAREGLLHPLGVTGDNGLIQRKLPGGAREPHKKVGEHRNPDD